MTFVNQYKYNIEDFNASYNPSNYEKSFEKKTENDKKPLKVPSKNTNEDNVPSLSPPIQVGAANFEVLDTVESRMDISNNPGSSEEEKDHEVSYDLDRDDFEG